jgi:hydroxymethylpyrimidine pyrophosphatase-like HAD family hydrolase
MTPPIRLLLFDIDGVLTAGEAQPLDLALLANLMIMNRAAREDPRQPAVTLCTGRPAPYVEVMLQAIDGHLPAVFENGCGLYQPAGYQFHAHPLVAASRPAFVRVRERLRAALVETGQVFFQPGKDYSLSLFPLAGVSVDDLRPLAEAALGSDVEAVSLVYSFSCLNVVPRGVDKSAGLRYLCEATGYAPEEVLGVGDSDVDLPFLSQVGYSAAPANANAAVKALVDYVSPYPTAHGVRDILKRFRLPAPLTAAPASS